MVLQLSSWLLLSGPAVSSRESYFDPPWLLPFLKGPRGDVLTHCKGICLSLTPSAAISCNQPVLQGCVSRDALPSSGQMWAAKLRVQIGFHLHKLNPKNTGRDGKRSEEERGGKKQGRGCEERGREERGNMNMSSKVNFREMRQINRKLTSCKCRVQNFISSSQETTGRF